MRICRIRPDALEVWLRGLGACLPICYYEDFQAFRGVERIGGGSSVSPLSASNSLTFGIVMPSLLDEVYVSRGREMPFNTSCIEV